MTSIDRRAANRRAGTCLLILLLSLVGAVCLARAGSTATHVTTTEDVVDARAGECGAILASDLPGPDGLVSLREALCAANNDPGADTIVLAPGVYALTTHGPQEDANVSGDLDVLGSLTLIGAGASESIVDGDEADRVLHIDPNGLGGVAVHVEGIGIRNGAAGSAPGGGLFNRGNLTVNDSQICSNTLSGFGPGALGGGGIYNDGTVTVSDSEIINNVVTGTAGGGLSSTGVSKLARVTISGNEAREAWSGSGSGGGIANSGQITVTSCVIRDNHADDSGGGLQTNPPGTGGAVIVDTLIQGNSAGRGGGAIDCTSSLEILDSEVISNTAGSGGGGVQLYAGAGDTFRATLIATALAHNSAGDRGGGLLVHAPQSGSITLVITRSTVTDNQAASGGGLDVYLNNGGAADVELKNTTVSDNRAVAFDGGGANISAARLSQADVTLEGVTLCWNEARWNGGALATWATSDSGAALTLTNCTMSGNQTERSGGGLFASRSTVRLVHTTVSDNYADADRDDEGDGGGIRASGGDFRAEGTLVAQNTDRSSSLGSIHPDISGDVDGAAYNLIGTTMGGDGTAGWEPDIVSSTPGLTGLADWGGETETHRLLPGSPAVDAVPAAACTLAADQRGKPRPEDGDGDGVAACDVGSYELHRFYVYLPHLVR